MSELSISEIREKFSGADEEKLKRLITAYEKDGRAGVKRLVISAVKKLHKIELERQRLYGMSAFEREYADLEFICGIDEVGRGPLAGPVCACAIILPKDVAIFGVNDSKKVSEKKREQLYEEITQKAVCYGIGTVSHKRIDEVNILNATYEAMREAINNLSKKPDILLNDAVTIPDVQIRQVPIVKGDSKSISIAAASIVAKVTRDRLMTEYDKLMPEYKFAKNKGYGTEEHIEAIKKYGLSPIHRRTFTKGII